MKNTDIDFSTYATPENLNITKAAIAALEKKYKGLKADDTKSLKVLKTAIGDVRNRRVAVEKRRKELKYPLLKAGKDLDAVAAEITTSLENIEEPLKAEKKRYDDEKERIKKEKEEKERKRVETIQRRIGQIESYPQNLRGRSSEQIERSATLFGEYRENDTFDYEEFTNVAEETYDATQRLFDSELEHAKAEEAKQAELERQRLEQAKIDAAQKEKERVQKEREEELAKREAELEERLKAANIPLAEVQEETQEEKKPEVDYQVMERQRCSGKNPMVLQPSGSSAYAYRTDKEYYIWSNEHRSWWGAGRQGYTRILERAGTYSLDEAVQICNGANYGWNAGEGNPSELPIQKEAAALLCTDFGETG